MDICTLLFPWTGVPKRGIKSTLSGDSLIRLRANFPLDRENAISIYSALCSPQECSGCVKTTGCDAALQLRLVYTPVVSPAIQTVQHTGGSPADFNGWVTWPWQPVSGTQADRLYGQHAQTWKEINKKF